MKEPDMITCTRCGKAIPTGDVCTNCGSVIDLTHGMKVHYKDFKGTEMLDIKMSSPARGEHASPVQNKTETANKSPLSDNKRSANKPAFFFWATVVILLSAIAWYYLLRYFLDF